jgi:hypothetical protein
MRKKKEKKIIVFFHPIMSKKFNYRKRLRVVLYNDEKDRADLNRIEKILKPKKKTKK